MSQGINRPVNESAPYGGKTVYGATLGILMLETEFPRVHGDVGNTATFDFPVLYKVVPGATSYRVVREQGAGLDDAFADAARELVQIGADGVGTRYSKRYDGTPATITFWKQWPLGIINLSAALVMYGADKSRQSTSMTAILPMGSRALAMLAALLSSMVNLGFLFAY
ncbi:MAG: hypothetical protein VX416_10085, partial [Pseudomonadota bacterium]|nr:hypothetical protein [Pseudomonadota bacterium]